MARIHNRKLAARIKQNDSHLRKLLTERINHLTTEEYQAAYRTIQTDIQKDEQALLDAGFDRNGNRIVKGVPSKDTTDKLIAKLSPRYLKLSAKMRWVIDAVTGQDYGSRGPMGQAPTHLNITSDGFVMTGGAGSEGAMFIGGYESFKANLDGVLDTVDATTDERTAFWQLVKQHVTDWRP